MAQADPRVQSTTPRLETNKRGYVQANRKGLFARGDIVTGSATVILARDGRRRSRFTSDDGQLVEEVSNHLTQS